MPDKINTITALKEFFGSTKPVEMAEIKALRTSMKQEDWDELGKACATALGKEWEAPAGR